MVRTLGKKYSKKVAAWEIDRVVDQQEPQPVMTRKATPEEMARKGRTEFVEYEDNYDRKHDDKWREFEKKHYASKR